MRRGGTHQSSLVGGPEVNAIKKLPALGRGVEKFGGLT
jgi:hypothetical protein